MASTLLDRVWDAHLVRSRDGEPDLLFIDLHLVQEVSSPQAFDGLRLAGRPVRRPDLTLATADHAVSTRVLPMLGDELDPGVTLNRAQLAALRDNCREHDIPLHDVGSAGQGIVHVIGPELGLTQPGMTIVCGDSHTTTHGAFGALALGIGSSEVEHVLATQCLPLHRPRTLLVRIEGTLAPHVTAKDLSLALIHRHGSAGATGHAVEYQGPAVDAMTMEGRMTLCNMSIETGARVGMIAPDETTLAYLRGRPSAPSGADLDAAREAWSGLRSDPDAHFDQVWHLDAATVEPMVTWGTTPAMSVPVGGRVPDPATCDDPAAAEQALAYMGLRGGEAVGELSLDRVFIGSCTNGRIEDLRAAADVVRGRHVAPHVEAMVVPGSAAVRRQAEEEGLGDVFEAAGFSWRLPGCSMCVAINDDRLEPGQRCASTSNRNFEGRQGTGGRTHLVSPAMAAAAAVHGRFVDVRELAAPHHVPTPPDTSPDPLT